MRIILLFLFMSIQLSVAWCNERVTLRYTLKPNDLMLPRLQTLIDLGLQGKLSIYKKDTTQQIFPGELEALLMERKTLQYLHPIQPNRMVDTTVVIDWREHIGGIDFILDGNLDLKAGGSDYILRDLIVRFNQPSFLPASIGYAPFWIKIEDLALQSKVEYNYWADQAYRILQQKVIYQKGYIGCLPSPIAMYQAENIEPILPSISLTGILNKLVDAQKTGVFRLYNDDYKRFFKSDKSLYALQADTVMGSDEKQTVILKEVAPSGLLLNVAVDKKTDITYRITIFGCAVTGVAYPNVITDRNKPITTPYFPVTVLGGWIANADLVQYISTAEWAVLNLFQYQAMHYAMRN